MNAVVEIIPKFRIGERVRVTDSHSASDLRGKEGTINEISVVIADDRIIVLYRLALGQWDSNRVALQGDLITLDPPDLPCEPILMRHKHNLWDWVKVLDAPGAPDLVGRRGTVEQILVSIADDESNVRYYVNAGSGGRRYLQESGIVPA